MLMLLNYLCYLCYCVVRLSLKEVYFGLSWQPVKAQELRVNWYLGWQDLPTSLMPSQCCADSEGGCQVIILATSPR